MASGSPDLTQALNHLMDIPRGDGRGRMILFMAAENGSGTSHVVRELSRLAVAVGKRVLLAQLDLSKGDQYLSFANPVSQAAGGALSGPYQAEQNGQSFWKVTPAAVGESGQNPMKLYRVGTYGPDLTYFDWTLVRPGQNVFIVQGREYWSSVRDIYDLIFVDAPAADVSEAGLTVAPEADGTVIIAPLNRGSGSGALADRIKKAQAHCVGTILNAPNEIARPYA